MLLVRFEIQAWDALRLGKAVDKKRKRESIRKTTGDDSGQRSLNVSTFYLEQRLTLEKIAQRIKTSRSTVSRLLEEARERDIVPIRVSSPWLRVQELEERLDARFGLREARVLYLKSLRMKTV